MMVKLRVGVRYDAEGNELPAEPGYPQDYWRLWDGCTEVDFSNTWQVLPEAKIPEDCKDCRYPDYDLRAEFGYADFLYFLHSGRWCTDALHGEDNPYQLARWVAWTGRDLNDPEHGSPKRHLLVTDHEPLFILSDSGQTVDRV